MAEILALSKIRNVREQEKNDAQKAYHQSTEFFEDIATKMFQLLKKKENAEKDYEDAIQQAITLDKIREQNAYIERLNKQIMDMQNAVQHARNDMELKQSLLTEAHVEMKKFDKIIEMRQEEKKAIQEKMEKSSMDEVSIQQYLSHINR
ncbi:chemotaxis CheF protein [Oceanobacillus picturae]|uniref:Flagellar FliJ protein n=1 Tax=Oceanobacillus picturae TaxID=171693 RepID=W9A9T0_9BACI|nr:flagellar export protein FliJ [Oceanobacillus picturae]RIU96367.1 flagellar export protein FliJ [Oceanobacillus picturae]GAQ16097.1 chemotaxis CheF protein [Oceanobacillus picturae]CDO02233.1 Chemotaxis CheF protein [Oceanobacillus picturae]